MTRDALYAQWQQEKARMDEMDRAAAAQHIKTITAELEVLRAEGRPTCPRARWIEAFLPHDMPACSYWSDRMYPTQATVTRPATPDEVAALQAEAEAASHA